MFVDKDEIPDSITLLMDDNDTDKDVLETLALLISLDKLIELFEFTVESDTVAELK
jgi:hypothetical protein